MYNPFTPQRGLTMQWLNMMEIPRNSRRIHQELRFSQRHGLYTVIGESAWDASKILIAHAWDGVSEHPYDRDVVPRRLHRGGLSRGETAAR